MAEEKLARLFTSWSGTQPASIEKLPGSGSNRVYFRLRGSGLSAIGAWNDDIRENDAFVSFTRHFHKNGFPVAEVLSYNCENRVYLITDLGDTTLYQLLSVARAPNASFPSEILDLYKKALQWLPEFQITAGAGIDYAKCYPRNAFDRQSMVWDLNYFKYYFLKLAGVPYDEQALEDDFQKFCGLLLEARSEYFLYRDFQSRNIMIFEGQPWFIDYQGGRKGALQYDVASLLFDGKADLPPQVRTELLNFYLEHLSSRFNLKPEIFLKSYPAFILIRILQALGAYGFRGFYEKKTHFLQSIPFALNNLRFLRTSNQLDFGLDSLMRVIDLIVDENGIYCKQLIKIAEDNKEFIFKPTESATPVLIVRINSFSYKKAIPGDQTGNGGGFVFDCRALPNPGRFEQYMEKTGKDLDVIHFLQEELSVKSFLDNVFSLVDQSVSTYTSRGFENLMVSFGCTGGRHRSVYCAEQLARRIQAYPQVKVVLRHIEQE
ncbi:MAG: phosphotransferase [Bacteroidetes bacterium]|nr:phosphotransferase [Bacteroidota bacterium]